MSDESGDEYDVENEDKESCALWSEGAVGNEFIGVDDCDNGGDVEIDAFVLSPDTVNFK